MPSSVAGSRSTIDGTRDYRPYRSNNQPARAFECSHDVRPHPLASGQLNHSSERGQTPHRVRTKRVPGMLALGDRARLQRCWMRRASVDTDRRHRDEVDVRRCGRLLDLPRRSHRARSVGCLAVRGPRGPADRDRRTSDSVPPRRRLLAKTLRPVRAASTPASSCHAGGSSSGISTNRSTCPQRGQT